MRIKTEPLRILDFDCESRPLGWLGSDYVHQEVTVIAWSWIGSGEYHAKALGKDDRSRARMLRAFRKAYDAADMVVGHYIRGFDLSLVNAMLVELGDRPLGQKLSHDTKIDLVKLHGVSKSQANLSAMFGIAEEKVLMTTQDWRESNRLTRDGISKAIERAVFDVAQNIALRDALLAAGVLGPPRVWRP